MNTNWLKDLAPAHAPPAPPWWPPAVGWWVLMTLILLLLAGSSFWWRRSAHARHIRLRRRALAEIERIRDLKPAERAPAIQNLLRRYALMRYGANTVAPLSGEAWLRFIEAHGGSGLAGGAGERFLAAAYGKRRALPETDWTQSAEGFIRHTLKGHAP